MSVDVVIVSWNSREDTLRCVEATVAQTSRLAGAGVIVVDNGSRDRTSETLSRLHPNVTVVRLEQNRGFTGGVAAGVEASNADSIVLLNNDGIPEPGWLEALVDALGSSPADIVAVGGKIIDFERKRADFVRGAMTFDGHGFQLDFRRALGTFDEPQGGEALFACGGNMIARRSAFTQLGGLDDDYFAYLEDVDFGWRAWIAGNRVFYTPDAVIRHKSSATSDRLGAFERGVLFERNALQTVFKNYEKELLQKMSGSILLTYLHRLHRYVIDRNGDTSELTRPAFGEISQVSRRRKRRFGRRSAAEISDPLSVMQFRALDWFFRNSERLMKKRETVQATRKRPDAEIFQRFPLYVVPTYHGDGDLMSTALFREIMSDLPTEQRRLDEIMER
jgi:GT2 family glycosyltransferase